MHTRIFTSILTFLLFFSIAPFAFAHVVVKPQQVGVATFQAFTVGVPSEKDVPTTQVRLLIPEGVNYVTPNVKPGWTIDIKKMGEDEEAKVTEITWTGGEIPGGLRDEFSFSAQSPANPTTVIWKAYQTYADGETVAWDTDPKTISSHEDSDGDEDHETTHPYSETEVINDLVKTPVKTTNAEGTTINNALTIGYIALALAAISLGLQLKRNNQNLQNKTRKT
jgi:uncharacterized protein YcnI